MNRIITYDDFMRHCGSSVPKTATSVFRRKSGLSSIVMLTQNHAEESHCRPELLNTGRRPLPALQSVLLQFPLHRLLGELDIDGRRFEARMAQHVLHRAQ